MPTAVRGHMRNANEIKIGMPITTAAVMERPSPGPPLEAQQDGAEKRRGGEKGENPRRGEENLQDRKTQPQHQQQDGPNPVLHHGYDTPLETHFNTSLPATLHFTTRRRAEAIDGTAGRNKLRPSGIRCETHDGTRRFHPTIHSGQMFKEPRSCHSARISASARTPPIPAGICPCRPGRSTALSVL